MEDTGGDSSSLGKLSYKQFWGDSERQDLLPPQEINVQHSGDKDKVAFSIDLDKKKLDQLLRFEGVRDGKPVDIELNYDRNLYISNDFKGLLKGFVLGSYRDNDNRSNKIRINIGSIYDIALLTSPKSDKQFQDRFGGIFVDILAHEFGHARQPKNTKGVTANMILMIQGGSFILFDLARRIQAPWLGLLEPLILQGESIAAGVVTQAAYTYSPAELFANEYKDLSVPLWRDVVKIGLRSEDQKEKDYFWSKVNIQKIKQILNKKS